MLIEQYFDQLEGIINICDNVHAKQDARDLLIFRYDNTRHFPALPTFPHHKHTPEGVVPVSEPDLQMIVAEVLDLI